MFPGTLHSQQCFDSEHLYYRLSVLHISFAACNLLFLHTSTLHHHSCIQPSFAFCFSLSFMCGWVSTFILLNYVYVSILHNCTNGNYLCLVIILEKAVVVSGLYQVPRVQSLTQQTEGMTYVCDEL